MINNKYNKKNIIFSFLTESSLRKMSTGTLTVILSCMFGGKTSELFHIINTHGRVGRCLFINHANDKRDPSNPYSTHNLLFDKNIADKVNADMAKYSSLKDIALSTLATYSTVCIDEGQFFNTDEDIAIVKYMVNTLNQSVFIAGLKGDYKKRPFGRILELISEADDVRFLRDTFCERCARAHKKSIAIHTHRIADTSQQQIEIGADNYIPVCRACYNDLNCTP